MFRYFYPTTDKSTYYAKCDYQTDRRKNIYIIQYNREMATMSQPNPAALLGAALFGGGMLAMMCCKKRKGKVLENSEFGIRLEYPIGWEGETQSREENSWTYRFVPSECEDAEVTLVVDRLSKPMPLEVYAECAKSGIKTSLQEFASVSDQIVELPTDSGIRVFEHQTAEYFLKLSAENSNYLVWGGCVFLLYPFKQFSPNNNINKKK